MTAETKAELCENRQKYAVFRIRDILRRTRILRSVPYNGYESGSCSFYVNGFRDANKNKFFVYDIPVL
jgi:hypothetical protein